MSAPLSYMAITVTEKKLRTKDILAAINSAAGTPLVKKVTEGFDKTTGESGFLVGMDPALNDAIFPTMPLIASSTATTAEAWRAVFDEVYGCPFPSCYFRASMTSMRDHVALGHLKDDLITLRKDCLPRTVVTTTKRVREAVPTPRTTSDVTTPKDEPNASSSLRMRPTTLYFGWKRPGVESPDISTILASLETVAKVKNTHVSLLKRCLFVTFPTRKDALTVYKRFNGGGEYVLAGITLKVAWASDPRKQEQTEEGPGAGGVAQFDLCTFGVVVPPTTEERHIFFRLYPFVPVLIMATETANRFLIEMPDTESCARAKEHMSCVTLFGERVDVF